MAAAIVVRSLPGERFAQRVVAGEHDLVADEPASAGGSDRGPGPYEYLLAALGSCTAITLRMYAERKAFPLEGVEVRLEHNRIHARDCADCETEQGQLDEIRAEVLLLGDLEREQRDRLMAIAARCPVHRTLVGETRIRLTEAGDARSSRER